MNFRFWTTSDDDEDIRLIVWYKLFSRKDSSRITNIQYFEFLEEQKLLSFRVNFKISTWALSLFQFYCTEIKWTLLYFKIRTNVLLKYTYYVLSILQSRTNTNLCRHHHHHQNVLLIFTTKIKLTSCYDNFA